MSRQWVCWSESFQTQTGPTPFQKSPGHLTDSPASHDVTTPPRHQTGSVLEWSLATAGNPSARRNGCAPALAPPGLVSAVPFAAELANGVIAPRLPLLIPWILLIRRGRRGIDTRAWSRPARPRQTQPDALAFVVNQTAPPEPDAGRTDSAAIENIRIQSDVHGDLLMIQVWFLTHGNGKVGPKASSFGLASKPVSKVTRSHDSAASHR